MNRFNAIRFDSILTVLLLWSSSLRGFGSFLFFFNPASQPIDKRQKKKKTFDWEQHRRKETLILTRIKWVAPHGRSLNGSCYDLVLPSLPSFTLFYLALPSST